MAGVVRCRAKLESDCLDGQQGPPMQGDGTFDGETIVCDPCYAKACLLTPSGAGLNHELPVAIDAYRQAVAFLRENENPVARAKEAREVYDSYGGSLGVSASLMAALAEREVKRRAGDQDALPVIKVSVHGLDFEL